MTLRWHSIQILQIGSQNAGYGIRQAGYLISMKKRRLQNGKSSGCLLEALARAPGNQLSPLLDRRSKIIPDGMGSVQTFGSVHLVRFILCTSGTPDTAEICVGNSF
jgi:hypothetical protein